MRTPESLGSSVRGQQQPGLPSGVGERRVQIRLTKSFTERLAAIQAFWDDAGAPRAYGKLLDELRSTVIPNLRRFPRIGQRYLDKPPQSVEALTQLAVLPRGAADALRKYLHDEYLILYTLNDSEIHLLSIRHHRQLSFDFSKLWEP